MSYSEVKKESTQLLSFAEYVVDRAAILDDSLYEKLVVAFSRVDRRSFFPPACRSRIFEDISLPQGFNTFSIAPSMWARILSLVGAKRGARILQLGCASGFESAVLSELGVRVFALEAIGPLAQETRRRLDKLDFQNVLIRRGPEEKGWPDEAPYDAIVALSVFENLPEAFTEQLIKPGGRMVLPVYEEDKPRLMLYESHASELKSYKLEKVDFISK